MTLQYPLTDHRQLCGYYWREDRLIGNLGDALAPILVRGLGYDLVSRQTIGPAIANPGKTLLVIGSLLTVQNLSPLGPMLEVWGSGWKGSPLPAEIQQRLVIHAVRGPLTAAGLGLPPGIPLGDPALLLPRFVPRPVTRHGKPVVVPHFHRTRSQSARQRQQRSGCHELLSTMVIQPQGIGRPGWLRQLAALAKTWLEWGMAPRTTRSAVNRLAGAGFVLTGSLHGAILAQAYGIPWAAYDDGYIDTAAKWQDWATYLGVELAFAANLTEGERWWMRSGRFGVVRDLSPLLAAFPYPIVSRWADLSHTTSGPAQSPAHASAAREG